MHCIDEPQLLIPVFKWSSLIILGNGGQKLGTRRRVGDHARFSFRKVELQKNIFLEDNL